MALREECEAFARRCEQERKDCEKYPRPRGNLLSPIHVPAAAPPRRASAEDLHE